MNELDQLAERLGALEAEGSARKEGERLDSFIGEHGGGFGGDRGIAAAILGEIDRRGIDTSAAGEAVQQILDEMRQEVRDLNSKIQAITEAVSEATGVETAPAGDEVMPPMEPPLPPMEEPLPPPPPDMGMPPEGDLPPLPPEGAEPPLPPMEESLPPPPGEVSDERMKKLKDAGFTLSDERMKKVTELSDERFKLIEDALSEIAGLPEETAAEAEVSVQAPVEQALTEEPVSEEISVEVSSPEGGTSGDFFNEFTTGSEDEGDLDEGAVITKALKGLKI